jgi:hypothetical protein
MSVSFVGITSATQLSDEQRAEIIAEYRRVRGSPFKVANNLVVPVSVVWVVVGEHPDALSARVERFGGDGRPNLRPFIIAKRKVSTPWDNAEPAIAKARADYEAGTHDMVTHRDGAYEFLCSIPQKRVTPRPDYFKLEL